MDRIERSREMHPKALSLICRRFTEARRDFPLASLAFWRIGGPADCFWDATSESELLEFLSMVREMQVPLCVIGRATNILFDDAGFRGCVVRIGPKMNEYRFEGNELVASAGCWTPGLVLAAAKRGLSGMEHCIGIPASLGGLICMNGGSQRRCISELVCSVRMISLAGVVREILSHECGFAYRESRFQRNGEIVTSAKLHFSEHKLYEVQRNQLRATLKDRRTKFPRKLPSCGSTFKSSPELYATYGPPGKIIEELGFKGRRFGGVQVSPLHANFIVNLGGASSRDVLELVGAIRRSAKERIGVDLEPEFRYIGTTNTSGSRELT